MIFGDNEFITFEEAMVSTRHQMITRFAKFVNPTEAKMFRLLDSDKRYVKAEGMLIFDDQNEKYLDFTAGYGALNLLNDFCSSQKIKKKARA